MKLFINFIFCFFLITSFLNAENEKLMLISFDRIFPETQIEQVQKAGISMYKLINDFEVNKSEKSLDSFLDSMFDAMINLHILIFLILKTQFKNVEDLKFLKNLVDSTNNKFCEKVNIYKSKKIEYINNLFDEAASRFDKVINQFQN